MQVHGGSRDPALPPWDPPPSYAVPCCPPSHRPWLGGWRRPQALNRHHEPPQRRGWMGSDMCSHAATYATVFVARQRPALRRSPAAPRRTSRRRSRPSWRCGRAGRAGRGVAHCAHWAGGAGPADVCAAIGLQSVSRSSLMMSSKYLICLRATTMNVSSCPSCGSSGDTGNTHHAGTGAGLPVSSGGRWGAGVGWASSPLTFISSARSSFRLSRAASA